MINSYELLEINSRKILVLKLDFSFEIGNFNKNNYKNLISMVKEYLSKINFKGSCDKIILTVSGIVLATIIYTKNGDLKLVSNDTINLNDANSIVENINVDNTIDDVLEEEFNFTVENQNKVVENDQETNYSESFTVEKSETQSAYSNNNTINSNKNDINVNKEDNIAKEEDNKTPEVSSSTNQVETEENLAVDKIVEEELSPVQDNTAVDINKNYVTVYRSNGTVEKIELEEYVTGVVAAEMPASFSTEALKAQAVVARTYALRKANY